MYNITRPCVALWHLVSIKCGPCVTNHKSCVALGYSIINQSVVCLVWTLYCNILPSYTYMYGKEKMESSHIEKVLMWMRGWISFSPSLLFEFEGDTNVENRDIMYRNPQSLYSLSTYSQIHSTCSTISYSFIWSRSTNVCKNHYVLGFQP